MNQLQPPSLDQALGLTKVMLDVAKSSDWEKLAGIESDRQKIILGNFENTSSIDHSSQLGKQIQQILDIDHEIQSLVSEARNAIRDELVDINRIKNQAQAYQSK